MIIRGSFWECIFCIQFAIMLVSCAPEDSERCGDNHYFEDGACYVNDAGGHGTSVDDAGADDAGADDAGTEDAGADDGLPSGLGEVCSDESGCAGFEADYCAQRPGQPAGYCTTKGCTRTPDECPGDFICCLFIITDIGNFCATSEDIAAMGPMCEG